MSRVTISLAISFMAAFCATAIAAPSAPRSFESEKAEAQANLSTGQGAAYDEQLGRYLMNIVGVKEAMSECMEQAQPPREVSGYFRFDEQGYRLILRPEGAMAKCFAKFFEGRDPPKPPRLPYVNDFNFSEND